MFFLNFSTIFFSLLLQWAIIFLSFYSTFGCYFIPKKKRRIHNRIRDTTKGRFWSFMVYGKHFLVHQKTYGVIFANKKIEKVKKLQYQLGKPKICRVTFTSEGQWCIQIILKRWGVQFCETFFLLLNEKNLFAKYFSFKLMVCISLRQN